MRVVSFEDAVDDLIPIAYCSLNRGLYSTLFLFLLTGWWLPTAISFPLCLAWGGVVALVLLVIGVYRRYFDRSRLVP